ncbi:MAG TPA: prohibitin family protein [Stellaceae bacterium]|nr:prohibitin family protein [Stellaceae bacterium]
MIRVFTRLPSRIGAAYTRLVDWIDKHLLSLGLGGLLFLLLIAALSPRMFITIPAGHEGALFRRFQGGTDVEQAYDEGFHVIWPWNTMYVYDVRFQNQSYVFDAHTSDGLNLRADVAYRFRVTRRNVPLLHKYIGPDYVEKLILPSLGAIVREEVSRHTPEEVYSTKRLEIQQRIREQMRREFEMDPEADTLLQRVEFVEIDEIYLRDVELPESLQKSMVEKNQQQQMMLEYDYRIERERKESERKRIEAEGIRQFQDIVKDGITDKYLMWKGIDATLQLAQSPNAKVVIIGGGKTGLPILLGNLDATIAPTTPAGGTPGAGGKTALTPLANTPEASTAEAKTPATASVTMPGDLGSKSSSQLALPPTSNTPATDKGTQTQPAARPTTGQ